MTDLFSKFHIEANSKVELSAQERLNSIISKVDALEQEKAEIQAEIKEIFDDAKGEGFDVPIIRKVLKVLKMKRSDIDEQQALIDTYIGAVNEYRQSQGLPALWNMGDSNES